MVFDEGDGSQLLAELLQHDHALQQSHVVDAATEEVGDEARAPPTGRQGERREERRT